MQPCSVCGERLVALIRDDLLGSAYALVRKDTGRANGSSTDKSLGLICTSCAAWGPERIDGMVDDRGPKDDYRKLLRSHPGQRMYIVGDPLRKEVLTNTECWIRAHIAGRDLESDSASARKVNTHHTPSRGR
jgi:hypothetical protein